MSTTAHWLASSRFAKRLQNVVVFSGCGSPQPSKEGPLAQLVERHAYTVDVIGSIPVGPTERNPKPLAWDFLFLNPRGFWSPFLVAR